MSQRDIERVRAQKKTGTTLSKSLRKSHSDDPALHQQIDDTDQAIRNMLPVEQRGEIVEFDAAAAGVQILGHALGGYPTGMYVIGVSGNFMNNAHLIDRQSAPSHIQPGDINNKFAAWTTGAGHFRVRVWR